MINIHNIVLYVLFGLLLLGFGFTLYKLFATNSKLNRVLDFLNGEVFSDQFQQVLRAYFSNTDNITPIIDQILPIIFAVTNHGSTVSSSANTIATQNGSDGKTKQQEDNPNPNTNTQTVHST
jgi:hypothetical protein